MSTSQATIHPRLLADCHVLGKFASGSLLLSRNSSLHWFILVPDTDRADLLDLPVADLHKVMADCQSVSAFLKGALGYPKVNFAGLGNVVPQMHLHIIGRREGDPCWPQPVWGQLPDARDWSAPALSILRDELTSQCDLQVPEDP